MINILVTGSTQSEENYEIYLKLAEVLSKQGDFVTTPLNTIAENNSSKVRFAKANHNISMANVIIAEVSYPSTGQGVELGIAYEKKKKVILIAKEGAKVSGVVEGMFGEPIRYKSPEDLMCLPEEINKRMPLKTFGLDE